MDNTTINLLPEQALEALNRGKLYKQKVYYLTAIGISLLIFTVLGIIVYGMYARTVQGREELLEHQNHRLEDLNPIWNNIIRLSQNQLLFSGVAENVEQVRTVLAAVLDGLDTLTLTSFLNASPGNYSMELVSPSKEESKRFDEYLRTALPLAETQQIETIQEYDDRVFFRITIQFPEAE